MTTITAKFKGSNNDLKTALMCAIQHPSVKKLNGNELTVEWITEKSDYQEALEYCMSLVNQDQLQSLGIETLSIN